MKKFLMKHLKMAGKINMLVGTILFVLFAPVACMSRPEDIENMPLSFKIGYLIFMIYCILFMLGLIVCCVFNEEIDKYLNINK